MDLRSRRKMLFELEGDAPLTKKQMLEIFAQLPDDSVVMRAQWDLGTGMTSFLVYSESFPEAKPHERYPTMELKVSFEKEPGKPRTVHHHHVVFPTAGDATMKLPEGVMVHPGNVGTPKCTCDMAYNGLRTHSKQCALVPK